MEMNVEKTKVMRISRQPSPVTIMIDQKQLENVEYTDVNFAFQMLINNFILRGYKVLWGERKRKGDREMERENGRQKRNKKAGISEIDNRKSEREAERETKKLK